MSMLTELKRRNVFKVAAAYIIVAWIVLQLASMVFPAFDAPPWALRIFMFIMLLGFPVALVTAWALEVTPQGVKVDPAPYGNKRLYSAATVLALLATGWYVAGQPSYRVGEHVADGTPSIAVLPFTNMSGNPDEEYFSDGMTEELLNVLAGIDSLKVVARTSVFQFKNAAGDVRQIGEKLGVSHIVEGSMRREGDRIRITAQLIRVADGFHIWSENYDRRLSSVFALQDEIALRIAEQLRVSLAPDSLAESQHSEITPDAYDEYLQGRALYRNREKLAQAVVHFRKAVSLAPDFAPAWANLSLTYEVLHWYSTPLELIAAGDVQALMLESTDQAARLAPDAAMTLHALGNVERSNGNFIAAERYYLRAIERDPGYADVREDYAEFLIALGHIDQGLEVATELVELEPYVPVFWWRILDVASVLQDVSLMLRYDDQIRALPKGSPDSVTLELWPFHYALYVGDFDRAREVLLEFEEKYPVEVGIFRVFLDWLSGSVTREEEMVIRRDLASGTSDALFFIAISGDTELLYESLDARAQSGVGLTNLAAYGFFQLLQVSNNQELLDDPRTKRLLAEGGFLEFWRARGWPEICQPVGEDDFRCGPRAGPATATAVN